VKYTVIQGFVTFRAMENEECDGRQPEAQELFLRKIRILLPLGYAYVDINPYRLGFLYAKSS